MRDEDEMLGFEPGSDRGDQFVIKFFEMRLRALKQGIVDGLDILRTQPELCELKLKQSQQSGDSRVQGYGNNFESLPSQQAEEYAVADLEVLDQQSIFRDCGANGGDGDVAGHLQTSLRSVGVGGIVQDANQFFFVTLRFLFEGGDAIG